LNAHFDASPFRRRSQAVIYLQGGAKLLTGRHDPLRAAVEENDLDPVRILCAILLPPLGVFLQVGLGGQFWLNILLTLLGYIPGIVHAVWIIATRGPSHT
jgi:uncharacterized membrane protein YqaE (UPF0057 family)